jgi:hypothetical protein
VVESVVLVGSVVLVVLDVVVLDVLLVVDVLAGGLQGTVVVVVDRVVVVVVAGRVVVVCDGAVVDEAGDPDVVGPVYTSNGVDDPGLGFQPFGGFVWDGTGPAVGTTTGAAGWATVGG